MISPKTKEVLRWALAALILGALVYFLAANWQKLRENDVRIDYPHFALAVFWNMIFFAVQAFAWRQCLAFVGYRLPVTTGASVWFISQISKYVPGKVMLLLVRIMYCEREKVPKSATMLSIYLELMLMVVTGFSVVLLFGRELFVNVPFLARHPYIPPALIALGVASLHPAVLNRFVNLGLKLIKQPPVEIKVPYASLLALGAVLGASWLFHGLSALASVQAVGWEPKAGLLAHTGFFTLGWLLGFLSFLTPGGLGVREGVLAGLLATIYPLEVGVAIALISRFAWVFAEILMTGLLWRARPKPKATAEP